VRGAYAASEGTAPSLSREAHLSWVNDKVAAIGRIEVSTKERPRSSADTAGACKLCRCVPSGASPRLLKLA
jgi:CxxC motif-containing protein (DUF1111 family)